MSVIFEILLITVTIEMSNGTTYDWKLDSENIQQQVILVDQDNYDDENDERVDQTKPGYTTKEWFNHFYEITHLTHVASFMLIMGQFDFEFVKELIPRTENFCLY